MPIDDALASDIIFLVVPLDQTEAATSRDGSQGQIVVDVTNAVGVSVAELGCLPFSMTAAPGCLGRGW